MSRVFFRFFVQILRLGTFISEKKRDRTAYDEVEEKCERNNADRSYAEINDKTRQKQGGGKGEEPNGYSVVSSSVRFCMRLFFVIAIDQF